jgi:hypothetical protein
VWNLWGRADTSVVEGDHSILSGETVNDSRVPVVMDALREALLAHFDTGGFSNGRREAMNC